MRCTSYSITFHRCVTLKIKLIHSQLSRALSVSRNRASYLHVKTPQQAAAAALLDHEAAFCVTVTWGELQPADAPHTNNDQNRAPNLHLSHSATKTLWHVCNLVAARASFTARSTKVTPPCVTVVWGVPSRYTITGRKEKKQNTQYNRSTVCPSLPPTNHMIPSAAAAARYLTVNRTTALQHKE